MDDPIPLPQPALKGIATPGPHGRTAGPPGVTVRELTGFGLASVMARRGSEDALAAAVEAGFGLALPFRPHRVDGPSLSMIWAGPEHWLALRPSAPVQGMEALLSPQLGTHAAITDQSHGRVLLRVSGPRVREALCKGIAIDLDPRAFRPGDTATTQVAHIGVQLWQLDAAPTYDIVALRGYAGSLWRWLELSAAEFGLEFMAQGPMESDGSPGP